jgi:hypothetical protein
VLTAKNAANVTATFQQTITIQDPNSALALLAGETTKTWKLYRVGSSMGVGPNADQPRIWWALENTGGRPCVYFHEFTFNRTGQFIFDSKESFWGEASVFGGTAFNEICFDAIAANMVNSNGADVSAWLSGTHAFTYNPTVNEITLTGNGAWMGLPQLGTSEALPTPVASKTFKAVITQHNGYDLMVISYAYADLYWDFTYASYANPADEPEVITVQPPYGTDLPDVTPTELYNTFVSTSSFALIGALGGGSVITPGEADPAGGTTNVGKFERVAGSQWQEAQIRTTPDLLDIQFTNFTKAKLDIYVPANTTFAEGGLVRQFVFGFADVSQTQEWWNSPVQFVVAGNDFVVGQWTTYEFDLTTVKTRTDLDMIYIGIGGGGHDAGGIFYVRNLMFE